MPTAINRYVGSIVLGGAAALLAALWLLPTDTDAYATIAVLITLGVAGRVFPLRFQRGGGAQGFNLGEGVFIAALITVPAGLVPLITVSGVVVGHLLVARDLRKVAFNTGQTALWAFPSAVVFAAVAGSEVAPLAAATVAGALIAGVVENLTSGLLMAELFRRLERRSYAETFRKTWRLNLITWAGNTAFGIILAVLIAFEPAAGLLAGVLMVGLYLGYRGYVGVVEERTRNDRLHDLTRTLADVTASDESTQRFLQDLRSVVGAEGAALLFLDGDDDREVRDGTAVDHVGPCGVMRAARSRGGPVLMSGDPVGGGHRDAMAAPVVYEQRTVGVIAVYDRYGLEPWDETDATLLGTIANEAAVALKNVELFAAVARERALLAEESRKLSDIVENASDGIAMIEADGRIAVWNEAMEVVTGVQTAHAFGQPWDVVLRLRDHEGEELIGDNGHVFSRALRGERGDEELDLQCLRRDGQWRWLRCSINPIERSGMGVVGAVLVARDVTRDREVDELKGDFIATVSHELRTPLTPLKGFLDTLSANGHKLNDEQRLDIHRAMRGQVERLDRLVGDLLVVADVERRELGLRLEPVDLPEVVAASLERLTPSLDPDRVTVEAPARLGAVGDRAAVTRIVTSLLDNALKHTDGPVRVRILREGEQAVCEVSDEGPGIAPWDHERVFHRFGRLGNHLHRIQGPGLGLPISRGLAQELGGDVTLESDLGKGATVRLTLPASAPRVVPEAANESAPNTA